MTSAKPVRLIFHKRDASYRPSVRTLADVLDLLEHNELEPIGHLLGKTSDMFWCCGRWCAHVAVAGETEQTRFSIGIPMSRWFKATSDGSRREFPISHFRNAVIAKDGTVRFSTGTSELSVKHVEFVHVDLPFELSDLQRKIAKLTSAFCNETGLSKSFIGRELSEDFIEYGEIAKIRITALAPIAQFVGSHWHTIGCDTRPPSEETIAATLEALAVRPRRSGKHAIRTGQILPQIDLRAQTSPQRR